MNAWVYMLRCRDDSFYIGTARGSLERRVQEHETGSYRGYTFRRRPVALVYSESSERIEDAIAAERQMKGWSRAKKQALINGDWERIRTLASRSVRPKPILRDGAGAPPQDEGASRNEQPPHPEERQGRVSKGVPATPTGGNR